MNNLINGDIKVWYHFVKLKKKLKLICVIKLFVFSKTNFKWALDDCTGSINVKVEETNMQK